MENSSVYTQPTYKLVNDEQMLKDFIDWLPDTQPNEAYQIFLFSRKKWVTPEMNSNLTADKNQFKRVTSQKKDLFTKIKSLEVPIGCYQYKGVNIPNEALGVYITLNPRNLEKAAIQSTKTLLNLVTNPYNGYNPHQIVMTEIQKADGKKRYLDFDFDFVDYETLSAKMKGVINEDCVTYVQTRGGIHLLIELEKVDKKNKTWHQAICNIEGCDLLTKFDVQKWQKQLKVKTKATFIERLKYVLSGGEKTTIQPQDETIFTEGKDILLPVIGCSQGEFTPHFINK